MARDGELADELARMSEQLEDMIWKLGIYELGMLKVEAMELRRKMEAEYQREKRREQEGGGDGA